MTASGQTSKGTKMINIDQMTDSSEDVRAAEVYERFTQRSSKDDEFSDWAGYREQLTDFVVRNTRPGASLMILGAGKCNDLDLGRLAEHCDVITLSDYRPETVEEACERYGLNFSEKLKFSGSDYVGIPDEDYIKYTRLLIKVMEKTGSIKGESLEETAGKELAELLDELDQIYLRNKGYDINLGDQICDNAVASGIHSQLNNSFRGIFQYVRKDAEDRGLRPKYLEELNSAIFQCTRKHTPDLVRRFNRAAFSAVKDGIIYGYEKNMIYTPEGEKTPVIGTVDGARQAGEEVADFTAEDRMGCLWPLSRRRGIKFEMNICYFTRKVLTD